MTTTKSYSEKNRFASIYRSSLKEHLPIAIVALVAFALIILLPFVVRMVEISNHYDRLRILRWTKQEIRGVYLGEMTNAISMVMAVGGFATALFSTSYLHSKRRVDLYHSLPVRRPQLLTAHILASLTVLLGAFVAVTVAAMAVQIPVYLYLGIFPGDFFSYIAMELCLQTVFLLAAYLFTVFISVNVGTTLDAFAAAGAMGLIPSFVYLAVGTVWSEAMYGAPYLSLGRMLILSPYTFILRLTRYGYSRQDMADVVVIALIWLALSALFFCAAIQCYKRRRSELAEQPQQHGVPQTIVKCFAAFLGAMLFYLIFDTSGFVVHLIAMTIGAVLVGTVAELILSRGVKSLKKNLKWLAGTGVACCLLLAVIGLDPFGYQTKIPAADSIESVTVDYYGRAASHQGAHYTTATLSNPESIAIVRGAHQAMVDYHRQVDKDYIYVNYFTLRYQLKNGRSIQREYNSYGAEAYLMLAALETQEDYIRQSQPIFQYDNKDYKQEQVELINSIRYYDDLGYRMENLSINNDQRRRLIEAIQQDMLEEPFEEIASPSAPLYGYLEIGYRVPTGNHYDEYGEPYEGYWDQTYTVLVSHTYTRTTALLQELGIEPGVNLNAVEAAYIVSAWPFSFNNESYQIMALTPAQMTGHYDLTRAESASQIMAYTEDPALIEELYDSAQSQLLMEAPEWYKNYLIVNFRINGRTEYCKIIPFERLPEKLRLQVESYWESEE